jgi:hypothetical protein
MGIGGEAHKYSIGGSTAETKALLRTAGVEDGSETRANSTPVSAAGTVEAQGDAGDAKNT